MGRQRKDTIIYWNIMFYLMLTVKDVSLYLFTCICNFLCVYNIEYGYTGVQILVLEGEYIVVYFHFYKTYDT